ncbi:MAG: hypothetical protein COV96_01215 [Candidatus Zambryskibacteria bacterium CG11_big_fil_rev_8_21_14_0_20_42_18]|nr:MAG: hypothetical protein COV96_01215 [Candidatus Zambryskibacteria bacterium CG11_big_fil_rev_8_21_14_0_20_42_18]
MCGSQAEKYLSKYLFATYTLLIIFPATAGNNTMAKKKKVAKRKPAAKKKKASKKKASKKKRA